MYGKIMLVKSLVLSCINYIRDIVTIPEQVMKELEVKRMVWEFVWGGKPRIVPDQVTCTDKKREGLSMTDL